jgi:thiol-disulfide isomerase/thioredoxin
MSTSLVRSGSILVVLAALAGCKKTAPPNTEMADASVQVPDAPGAAATCPPPADSPFGASVNRYLRPFTLPRCDGTEFRVYEDSQACTADLTYVTIAAGWCGPCMEESTILKEKVIDAYAGRVNVVQVLYQDPARRNPTPAFCNAWVNQYGLQDVPVLMDMDGMTSTRFPYGSLPTGIFLDRTGKILAIEEGFSEASLLGKIDALLAAQAN